MWTSHTAWRVKDMRRDPRVALSVSDIPNEASHENEPTNTRGTEADPR